MNGKMMEGWTANVQNVQDWNIYLDLTGYILW